jgi:hypothetical protein
MSRLWILPFLMAKRLSDSPALPSGKIAVLGDPQGAAFAVFEGETDE